jgi:HlyD family secretion protein
MERDDPLTDHSGQSPQGTIRFATLRRVSKGWLLLAVLGVAGGGFAYRLLCAPTAVNGHRIERGAIAAEVMGTGTLEARLKATISPKISGRVREVLVDQGESVDAGQLLVRLDREELAEQVEMAQAGLSEVEAAEGRHEAERAQAEAVAVQSRRERDRIAKLSASKMVTEAESDKVKESWQIAEAGLAKALAAIAEARQQRRAAERNLEYQRARLADTEIRAPFAGLITRRHRDPGDVVVPGSAVLSMVSTRELWISAWVDETEMARLRPGQSTRVVFRCQPETPCDGCVARLGREADRETREFLVDVRLTTLPENWAIGQRADVFVTVARQSAATLLPLRYLFWRDDAPGVWLFQAGVARWRPLRIGLRSRDATVILDGLAPGDCVLRPADPQASLADGTRVLLP